MTPAEALAQIRAKSAPASTTPAAPSATTPAAALAAIRAKKAAPPKSFRYELSAPVVPEETREAKIKRYQEEAAASAKESKEANSIGGFAKNFGKAFVSTIASSEVGLGKTVAAIIDNAPVKTRENVAQLQQGQTQLVKTIREKTAKGENTDKLRHIFNTNQDFIDSQLKEAEGAELPSTLKAVGQLGGTALDVLSAGTYGKAAQGYKTGVLGKAAIPGAVKVVTPAAKATGILTKPGAARVATGGAIGYTADVTQGLQGNRGEDREGAKALIPGLGTAIGVAIPAALEAEQSVKNAFSAEKFIDRRTKAFQDMIDNTARARNLDKKVKGMKGTEVAKVLASDDRYVPEVLDGKVSAEKAIAQIQEDVSPLAKVVRAVIESDDKHVKIQDLQDEALRGIDDFKASGEQYNRLRNNIISDFDYYRKNYGVGTDKEFIPLTIVDDIKKAKYQQINWNNPELMTTDRAVARAGRKIIEKSVDDVDVQGLNKELGKYYDAQEMLEALDGKAVKGGRLGKYFARGFGIAIGSPGGVGGSIAGGVIADQLASLMQSSYFQNPLVKAAVGQIAREQPEIFAQAEALVAQRMADRAGRLALPEGITRMPAPRGKDVTQVFDNYDDFLNAQGIERGAPDMLALPEGRPGIPEGGVQPIQIPARLPSSIDAAEAARRASGEIKVPQNSLPSSLPSAAKGATSIDLPPSIPSQIKNTIQTTPTTAKSPIPTSITNVPAKQMSPAQVAQFLRKSIQDHITESQEVLDNLPEADLKALGGLPALLERTRINLADGIAAEGFKEAGEAVRKIDLGAVKSLMDFAATAAGVLAKFGR